MLGNLGGQSVELNRSGISCCKGEGYGVELGGAGKRARRKEKMGENARERKGARRSKANADY